MANEDQPVTLAQLKQLVGSSGNNSSSKPGTINIDTDSLKKTFGSIYDASVPVVLGFQRLATGAEPAATAIANLGTIASAVGLEKFSSLISLAGNAVLANKTQVDEATKAGYGTNDVLRFTREAAQAGLTTAEWNKVLKESGSGIAGLAGSGARSADAFSQLSREVRESSSGVSRDLQAFGVTQQELSEYTALSLVNNRKLNLADVESRNKARAAAEEMALSITETALATGMSRDALAQQTKASLESADSFLVMNTLTDKQQEAFKATNEAIKPLGPAADHLQVAFQTGKWDDTAKGMYSALNAVNGSGDKLQSAQQQLMRAYESGNATQIEAAKQQQARAVADAQAAINSKEFAQVALTSNGNIAKVSKEIVSDVNVQRSARQARANAEEAGGSYEAGADKARLEARATIAGKKVDENGRPIDESGKATTDLSKAQLDAGQAISRGINEFDARIKTQSSAIATNFENINKEALKTPGAVKQFTDSVAGLAGPMTTTAAQAAKNQENLDNLIKSVKDLTSSTSVADSKGVSGVPASQQTSSGNLKPIKKGATPGKAAGGDIAENEEYIVGEEGPEKIKLSKPGVVTPNKAINSGINLEEISKTISTTISSAGGGSTTTSRVQNEDSKRAEAELEKVRGQYESDRQKLIAQTKVQLGPDASFKDIIKAMTTGDSAKALEEKYKALMDPLQKRMEDGTSIEVSRKEGVIEKTRQQVEEHTKILSTELDRKKSAASQSASIQADTEKVKMAGYEKEANLAKDVIGKSVDGLSEDAITALLPKGAKMDDFYIDMNNKLQSFSADYVNKIQENEKKKQEVTTSYSTVAVTEYTKQFQAMNPKELTDLALTSKGKLAEAAKEFLATGTVIPKSDQIRAITEQKKQIDDMFSKVGGGSGILGQSNTATEQKKQLDDMFSKIGGGGGVLGDMFNPKILDAKQAEINKAKFAEEDKHKKADDASKKAEAEAKSKTENKGAQNSKPPEHTATINDLNDQLKTLNSMMLQVISNTANMANHAEKITKNTKQGRF